MLMQIWGAVRFSILSVPRPDGWWDRARSWQASIREPMRPGGKEWKPEGMKWVGMEGGREGREKGKEEG